LSGGAIGLLIFGHIAKLKYGDGGKISGVTWDFDFSTNWPYIVSIVLLAAYAGYILYSRSDTRKTSLHFYLAVAVVLVVSSYQMYELNFVHYDDDQYPYVYAHTRRELLQMLDEIDRVSKRMGTGTDTGIALVSPDYWPLPWYFRDYTKVGYYQQIVATNEPIIIGSMAQEEQLKETYGDRYVRVDSGKDEGAYALRPGVDLLLYVRKDVAK
jgi:predicted membrane-bound mannosyltransferase